MQATKIRAMTERRYKLVPLARIKVLNSREREGQQFRENVRSIKAVGLLKPVVVNDRNLEKTGFYELVCGEGRFLAYQSLGREQITAEVVTCDLKTALLYSLVENIARVPPGTMWFAREVKRLHDSGWTLLDIATVVGKSESYVRDYIRLARQGEERLIRGVEQGLFSMSFALMVAKSDNASIQNILMDAFDRGIVNSKNLPLVRRIAEARLARRTAPSQGPRRPRSHPTSYSVSQLKKDIGRVTREKELFVHEAGVKENRLVALLQDLRTLWRNKAFLAIVQVEELDVWPKLTGAYGV